MKTDKKSLNECWFYTGVCTIIIFKTLNKDIIRKKS